MITSILLSSLQLILILYILLKEYRYQSVGVFLWAMLFVVFGLMHFETVIFSNHKYPLWVYNYASIFVILFCLIYLFVRNITLLGIRKSIVIPNHQNNVLFSYQKKYIKLVFYLLIFSSVFQVYSLIKYSKELSETSWESMMEFSSQQGLGVSLLLVLLNFSTASIYLSLYYKKKTYLKLSVLTILVVAIIFRERAALLPLLVSFISFYLFQNRKLNINQICLFAFLGIMSIFIIYTLQIFRYYGTISNFAQNFSITDFKVRLITQFNDNKGDLWLQDIFYYFIYKNNEFNNFGEGHTYLRMILVGIPTDYLGGLKPPDFAHSMGAAMGMAKGGSVHPTLFGDCFANFGYFGVLLGAFWALYVKIVDSIINKKDICIKLTLITLFASSYILIGRGSVYNGFFSSLSSSITVVIIYTILKKISHK